MFKEGPLLTSMQTSLLAIASVLEGFVSVKNGKFDLNDEHLQSSKHDVQNAKEYKELLMNLLFGSGKIIDKYIYNKMGIAELIDKGILTKIDNNKMNNDLSEIISDGYKKIFMAYRYLDNNRYTSNIISYEDIIVEGNRPTKEEIHVIEDNKYIIESGRELLNNILMPAIKNLSPIFDHYLQRNIHFYSEYSTG